LKFLNKVQRLSQCHIKEKGSRVQAIGTRNGNEPKATLVLDIVSSIWKHIAVTLILGLLWTDSIVANTVEDKCNRLGFSRYEISGELKKFQFFWEYSEEEMMFDSDAELYMHYTSLAAEAANKIFETAIQLDLQDNAGVVMYGGTATAQNQLDNTSTVDYAFFNAMAKKADDNYMPTTMKMITGSTKIDTRVIPNARVAYVPTELMNDIERMTDYHGKQAFVSVEHYASAGRVLENEAGRVGKFRIVAVQDMVLAGEGAAGATADFYQTSSGAYQVFPILVVGQESFNAITLHGGQKGLGDKFKWRVIIKKPGSDIADRHDVYGESGFCSYRAYYGFLPLRTERIIKGLVTARI